jgi:hypothetical protein
MQLASFRDGVGALLAQCEERNVAVQTIKAIARGAWDSSTNEPPPPRQSWYEPLTDPAAIARAVQHVLAQPGLFLDSPSATDQLPLVLAAAERRSVPTSDELAQDVARFGISPLFDDAIVT